VNDRDVTRVHPGKAIAGRGSLILRWLRWPGVTFILCVVGGNLAAAIYTLDPTNGSMSNPGTGEAPWSTLEAVAASGRSFEPGDVLLLQSGHHGSPSIRGNHSGEVTVRPAPGAKPTLKNLVIRAAQGWRIQGLEISPSTAPAFERVNLVSIAADATSIVLEDCRLFTVEETTTWSVEDWDTRACSAIDVRGARNVIRGNHLLNVNFGISVTGVSNRVEHNVVENFSGDGLRGLGDYGIFESNQVKNCYDVNGNHDDGFQSWSVGPSGVGSGVVRGIVLRGNRILNYSDPNQPHRGTLQGVGCFDGFFEDWIIENNEILTDHWHGITLAGARNCRIVNNTVVDLNTSSPGPPWIRIGPHKNGAPSAGNTVRNNLTTSLQVAADTATLDHNLVIDDAALFFRDYSRHDLRLREGCPAVDSGSGEDAPDVDIGDVVRPLDGDHDGKARWDVGAREFGHPSADADGDRMSDADEVVAGTSPRDAQDRLQVRLTTDASDQFELRWKSVPGRTYCVVSRGGLISGPWESLLLGIPGTGAELTYPGIGPVTAAALFAITVTEP